MNSRRILRFGFIAVFDSVPIFFTGQVLLDRSEEIFWRLLALTIFAGILIGMALEIRDCRAARMVNVGVPAALGIVLASSFIWLPMVARLRHWEHPGDANEGAAYLFIFSLLLFLLACLMELAYRLVRPSCHAE